MTSAITWATCLDYLEDHCNPSVPPMPPSTIRYAQVLWTVSEAIAARTILEIGIGPTSVSGCTFVHSMGSRGGGTLLSVDVDTNLPLPQHRELAARMGVFWLQQYGDSLDVVLPNSLLGLVDLLYVDGDHDFEHAYGDTVRFLPFLRTGGYLLIDDYPMCEGVRDAKARLELDGLTFVHLPHEPPHGNGRLLWQKR